MWSSIPMVRLLDIAWDRKQAKCLSTKLHSLLWLRADNGGRNLLAGRRESGGNAMATPSVETSLRSEGSGECEAAVESAQGRDIELEEEIGPSCMGLGSPPTAEASEHSMLRSEGDGKDGGQYLEVFEDRQLGSLTEVAKTPIHAKGEGSPLIWHVGGTSNQVFDSCI